MSKKLEARVKEGYNMGTVVAFSGHEYAVNEWRPVPAGFEPAALVHPLLDVRDAETQKEIKVTVKDKLADTLGTADLKVAAGEAVPVEAPASVEVEAPVEEEESEESKPAKRRSRKTSKKE